MKKIALLLGLGFTLSLVSCSSKTQTPDNDNTGNNNDNTDLPDNPGGEGNEDQDEPEVKEDSVELIYNLLVNTSYKAEINESNVITFSNIAEDSNKTITTTEDVHIFNNDSTIYYGTYDAKYNETPEFNETDTFIRKSEVKDYDGTKVYYDVTDYAKNNSKDDASRLPIVSNGSSDEDGVSYLLESSVPAQLTKQSSLYIAQFIDTNLLNNIDLGGLIPKVYYVENEDSTTSFYLHDFSYSYGDEGIETKVSISFDIVLDSNSYKLITASTIFEQTETQGENDSYVYKETNSYKVGYGERETSPTKEDINVEDYFITQVQSIRAYVLDGGNKIYYPLNGLPINKYIRFEAESYLPSKAVDTSMIILSTKRDEVIIDDETAYAETPISTLLTFESVTGVFFSQDVTFVKPSIEEIGFSCSDPTMEREYDDDYNVTYVVYNDTTYNDVFISISPSGFNEDELEITYEDEGLLTLTKVTKYDTTIRYTLTVSSNPNNISKTSITISSKENPSVKEVINFKFKKKSNMDEIQEYMLNHMYTYTNIYTGLTYKIKFTSKTDGIYYDNLGTEEDIQIPFTYTLNDDYTLTIKFSKETSYLYSETDISISRDGKDIALYVDDGSYATHHYIAIEE